MFSSCLLHVFRIVDGQLVVLSGLVDPLLARGELLLKNGLPFEFG